MKCDTEFKKLDMIHANLIELYYAKGAPFTKCEAVRWCAHQGISTKTIYRACRQFLNLPARIKGEFIICDGVSVAERAVMYECRASMPWFSGASSDILAKNAGKVSNKRKYWPRWERTCPITGYIGQEWRQRVQ